MTHIDHLQALVVIEHTSGQFNLYLSDASAVYFSLSLPDISHTRNAVDLELVSGHITCTHTHAHTHAVAANEQYLLYNCVCRWRV